MIEFLMMVAGVEICERRAYRSRHTHWVTPDLSISIHNSMNRDGSLTVFVNDKVLPRSYKTLNGAVRAAIKAKEQP